MTKTLLLLLLTTLVAVAGAQTNAVRQAHAAKATGRPSPSKYLADMQARSEAKVKKKDALAAKRAEHDKSVADRALAKKQKNVP